MEGERRCFFCQEKQMKSNRLEGKLVYFDQILRKNEIIQSHKVVRVYVIQQKHNVRVRMCMARVNYHIIWRELWCVASIYSIHISQINE